MGRTGAKSPNFCLSRVTTHFRVRSPLVQSKPASKSIINANEDSVLVDNSDEKTISSINGAEMGNETSSSVLVGRRIMIVVDSSLEAKGAIQWALSHTIQNHDTIILLHVTKPTSSNGEQTNTEVYAKEYELLYSLKSMCHVKRPKVQIEVAVVQGKEKGPTIVAEAKHQGVTLLILGQKKRSMTWRLVMMWAGSRIGAGVVEYCIDNASCMTIGVRRNNRKVGGYLITTKHHKDFWLLA
ncbi:hypothetical protein C5167_050179 [Papaver somniferum]|uniref:UspA domain-containing protein n=1 Tax=Papaver somniferum TaxID=3469 RepID=A0A4Y7KS34_PAPSO|nr:universal stress protein PHOS32-like isoform X2 [Papaver somniferum]RZC74695.1 hypothetical protein C5167_050179 [Papaver somniferum]